MTSRFRHFTAASIAGALMLFASTAFAQEASDTVAGATNIAATPFAALSDTSGATTTADEPVPGCAFVPPPLGGNSVWYRYTATTTADLAADTLGSNYDTMLVVWDGGPSGVQVGCNDDFNGIQSLVPFTAIAGHTYYFQIAFWRAPDPSFDPSPVLSFHLAPPPPPFQAIATIDSVGRAAGATGVIEIGGTLTCNRPGFVTAIIHVQQEHGRIAGAAVFLAGPCGPQPAHPIARLVGGNARFTPGQVTVTVAGTAQENFFTTAPIFVQDNVRLQGTSAKQLSLPPPPQP
jgi:hypothetical protein